jgi:predicted amino acid racemase
MTAPRLEIDLEKIRHNASTLVNSLKTRGISVTGITKATLGGRGVASGWCAGAW